MLMELVKAFARWWRCACLKSVSGVRRPEKSLNFSKYRFVFDLVLKRCSDINDWNWMQLFFYLFVLLDIVASVVGTCFFNCVSRFRLKFFLIAFWGNVCSWFPKFIWLQMDCVWVLFLNLGPYWLTLDLDGLNISKNVENYVSFDNIKSFR